jgi:hypothetical protein
VRAAISSTQSSSFWFVVNSAGAAVVESLIRLSLFGRFAAAADGVGALLQDLQRCESHGFPGSMRSVPT